MEESQQQKVSLEQIEETLQCSERMVWLFTGDRRIFAPRSKIKSVKHSSYAYNTIVASNTIVMQSIELGLSVFALLDAKILQSPVQILSTTKDRYA